MVRKALLLVFIVIILTGCSKQQDILSRIEYFSGVKMPNEAQLVYNYIDTSFGAQGHGCQYTVFSFEEEPIDFFTSEYSYGGELYWTSPEGEKHYRDVHSGTLNFSIDRMSDDLEKNVDHIVEQNKISDDFAPNWEDNYTFL